MRLLRRQGGWLFGGLLLCSAPVPPALFAQTSHTVNPLASRAMNWPGYAPPVMVTDAPSIGPGNAALRSALIPGAGQYALQQNRSWVYVGLEVIGWGFYADRRRSGAGLRREYRDYAWQEGRLEAGPRVDGDFDYYETLSKWDRSGGFDLDAGLAGVQPEEDPTAYNGLIWSRAVGIYSVDPAAGPGDARYDDAIRYYEERAYGPGFLWDWAGSPGARATYAGIIESSDERFRQARNALGFVIANHLVSAVDAFVSARARGVRIESRILPGPTGTGLTFAATLIRGRQ